MSIEMLYVIPVALMIAVFFIMRIPITYHADTVVARRGWYYVTFREVILFIRSIPHVTGQLVTDALQLLWVPFMPFLGMMMGERPVWLSPLWARPVEIDMKPIKRAVAKTERMLQRREWKPVRKKK